VYKGIVHIRSRVRWLILDYGNIVLETCTSLCFKINVTFGHKLRYEIKVTFGEVSLKLRQMKWNDAIINVHVVVDELPSQITVYTCLAIDI
jgi:hypothetical protein